MNASFNSLFALLLILVAGLFLFTLSGEDIMKELRDNNPLVQSSEKDDK